MLSAITAAGMLTKEPNEQFLFLCSTIMTLLRFFFARNEALTVFQFLNQITNLCSPEAPSHLLEFLVCVFFHFATHYFCLSPLPGFRTYYAQSLFSNLSYFPLELSLHTIANNPTKISHLCSWAFSINSHFSSFFKKKRKKTCTHTLTQLGAISAAAPLTLKANDANSEPSRSYSLKAASALQCG